MPDVGIKVTHNVANAWMILMVTLAVASVLKAGNLMYERRPESRNRPIKGFVQIVEIAIYAFGGVLVIGALLDRSPLVLLSGIAISFSFLDRLGDRAFFPFFAGIVNFIQFSGFYALGVLKRRDSEFHKHMMLFASISLVLPAFNRIIFSFDLPRVIAPVGWVVLFTVVPIYDLVKLRIPPPN